MNVEVKNKVFEQKTAALIPQLNPQAKPKDKAFVASPDRSAIEDKGRNSKDGILVKRMQEMLAFEAGLRRLKNKKELMFFVVNEARKLTNARQVFIAKCSGRQSKYHIEAISSMSEVDRNAPIVRWFEKTLKRFFKERGMVGYAASITAELEKDENQYPFSQIYHLPLKDERNKTFAALIFTRETAWSENELPILKRIEESVSYSWTSQLGNRGKVVRTPWKKLVGLILATMLVIAGFIPVPMSVLAPVQITASQPTVITAPFDGVIDEIYVRSGDVVNKGDLVFKMVDTDLVNRNKIALQDIEIARTRMLRSSRAAYESNDALQDLAIAETEYDLKIAEQSYAKSLLERSKAYALNQGVVLFGNVNDLIGKPVATGERIMRIADPAKTELKIEVALEDSIIIKNNASVKVFLDADPLNPIEAKVIHAALEAKEVAGGQLAYEVTAKINNAEAESQNNPRIGLRGTAQILGDKVPLAFYLFRRPLSAIRQWLGI
jgi:hypothetical protein